MCLVVGSGSWWRSGTTRAKNGRGESSIVVVGRIDVVGVVEVETERSSVGTVNKSARERLLEV